MTSTALTRAELTVSCAKIVIAGGRGTGKSTFVRAASDIPAIHTESPTTGQDAYLDGSAVRGEATTTVAMDFGRVVIDRQLVVYLFGAPGRSRFWYLWADLCRGAHGAVVLVDVRRLADSFASIDYFERNLIPYAVVTNTFDDGGPVHSTAELWEALALPDGVPLLRWDARDPDSARQVLTELVEYLITVRSVPAPSANHSNTKDPS